MQASVDPMEVFVARILRRSGSKSTVVVYKFAVLWLLKFLDLDPGEFVSKVERGEVQAEDQLNSWLDHLQANGQSPATQRRPFFAVTQKRQHKEGEKKDPVATQRLIPERGS